jgi:hypothetical protein
MYQAHPSNSAVPTAATEMTTDNIASLRMPMPRMVAGQAGAVVRIRPGGSGGAKGLTFPAD